MTTSPDMDLGELRHQLDLGQAPTDGEFWNQLAIAANRGNLEAQFLMGYRWFLRYGPSAGKASKRLKMASLGGHQEARQCLLSTGIAECTRAQAQAGDVGAMSSLGLLLACGNEGLTQDLEQARFWYLRAAQEGCAVAQYEIGLMQLRGEGGPRDPEQARAWLERTAEQVEFAIAEDAASVLARLKPS